MKLIWIIQWGFFTVIAIIAADRGDIGRTIVWCTNVLICAYQAMKGDAP